MEDIIFSHTAKLSGPEFTGDRAFTEIAIKERENKELFLRVGNAWSTFEVGSSGSLEGLHFEAMLRIINELEDNSDLHGVNNFVEAVEYLNDFFAGLGFIFKDSGVG